MPNVVAGSGCSANSFSRLASLPARRRTWTSSAADNGDAGTVVAAVLQSAEPFDDDVDGVLLSDVPDDSAHGLHLTFCYPMAAPVRRLEGRSADRRAHDGSQSVSHLAGPLGRVGLDHDTHERLGSAGTEQHTSLIAQRTLLLGHSSRDRRGVDA